MARLENNNRLAWYDDWHKNEWYKGTAKDMKEAMEDILATDLSSSRT